MPDRPGLLWRPHCLADRRPRRAASARRPRPCPTGTRPAADVVFAPAADRSGDRAVAVVLSGRRRGGGDPRDVGRGLAQNPATGEAPEAPAAAIRGGPVDFVLPLEGIAPARVSLVTAPGADGLVRAPRRPRSPAPALPGAPGRGGGERSYSAPAAVAGK